MCITIVCCKRPLMRREIYKVLKRCGPILFHRVLLTFLMSPNVGVSSSVTATIMERISAPDKSRHVHIRQQIANPVSEQSNANEIHPLPTLTAMQPSPNQDRRLSRSHRSATRQSSLSSEIHPSASAATHNVSACLSFKCKSEKFNVVPEQLSASQESVYQFPGRGSP